MTSPNDILNRAIEFAQEHVSEASAEILEWQATSLLRNGRVRELAEILKHLETSHALPLAETLVRKEALNVAAAGAPLEMPYCELRHVILKPNQPYVFTVHPNCNNCHQDAKDAGYPIEENFVSRWTRVIKSL